MGIMSKKELGVRSQELGVKMTPTIKGWGLNEINILSVSLIRGVSTWERESGFKKTSHQPVI